ncbi:hypothetical protein M5K25_023194 [Dendrobium thyrsiflorum]|uniref:Uncharacterized protein n=1 Tax=Dendrobium thyrsiflorum TaxID=117978 RepID=A0ABD0U7E5_DENTH
MVALRVTASLPSVAFAISLVRCRPAQRPPCAAFASFSSGGASSAQASPLQRQLHFLTPKIAFICCLETLPRLSPRLGIELIQKKIAAALEQ